MCKDRDQFSPDFLRDREQEVKIFFDRSRKIVLGRNQCAYTYMYSYIYYKHDILCFETKF